MSKPVDWLPCPKCHQVSGTRLPIMVNPTNDYYECDACGHVWTVPKHPLRAPEKP